MTTTVTVTAAMQAHAQTLRRFEHDARVLEAQARRVQADIIALTQRQPRNQAHEQRIRRRERDLTRLRQALTANAHARQQLLQMTPRVQVPTPTPASVPTPNTAYHQYIVAELDRDLREHPNLPAAMRQELQTRRDMYASRLPRPRSRRSARVIADFLASIDQAE